MGVSSWTGLTAQRDVLLKPGVCVGVYFLGALRGRIPLTSGVTLVDCCLVLPLL